MSSNGNRRLILVLGFRLSKDKFAVNIFSVQKYVRSHTHFLLCATFTFAEDSVQILVNIQLMMYC